MTNLDNERLQEVLGRIRQDREMLEKVFECLRQDNEVLIELLNETIQNSSEVRPVGDLQTGGAC